MSRSVVLTASVRCERCLHVPRWCICSGLRTIESPLKVDILMHDMEALRPSSTGFLIKRAMPACDIHFFRRDRNLDPDEILDAGRELMILHPLGEELPPDIQPSTRQVLLLDGTWRQAGHMLRNVEKWGKKVRLPMTGQSRYWLRSQQGDGRFSTVEALLFLLKAMGLETEWDQLRNQFELHVFAGLCSRGSKDRAMEYLANSPIREAMASTIESLLTRRRNEADGRDAIEPGGFSGS